MTTLELKEHLKSIIETERSLYEMDRVARNLQSERSKLAKPVAVDNPKLDHSTFLGSAFSGGLMFAVLLGVLSFVVCFFVLGIIDLFADLNIPFLENTIEMISNSHNGLIGFLLIILFYFAIGAVPGFLLGFLLMGVSHLSDRKRISASNEEKVSQYEVALQQEKHRMEYETAVACNLDTMLNQLRQQQTQTREVLNALYDRNIVYPKYRNLVPVCMFYEYLDSRRCTELEGHEGAINLYESELRLNRIIGKLDAVISRLDDIGNNQMVLYQAISEGNRTSRSMLENTIHLLKQGQESNRRLEEIQSQSALTAYHAAVTARNTKILADLKIREQMS